MSTAEYGQVYWLAHEGVSRRLWQTLRALDDVQLALEESGSVDQPIFRGLSATPQKLRSLVFDPFVHRLAFDYLETPHGWFLNRIYVQWVGLRSTCAAMMATLLSARGVHSCPEVNDLCCSAVDAMRRLIIVMDQAIEKLESYL